MNPYPLLKFGHDGKLKIGASFARSRRPRDRRREGRQLQVREDRDDHLALGERSRSRVGWLVAADGLPHALCLANYLVSWET